MEYNKLIAEMSLSDEVEGFYVLKAAYPKTTATGKPFLSASLSDRSGSIEIKVWDYSGPISSADEGNVVKIRGTVSEFRGTPQITVDRIRLADDNDMIGISKRLLLIPVLHPKFSVRNPSEHLATCILTMRMSLKSSGNIAAAELSIRQPKSWTCAFLSMASRETRAAKKTAIRLFCEEGSLWNML